VRIVAGRHRGRQLESPDDLPIRPTSDRAREALFNILEHGRLAQGGLSPVRSARVLDAFCGTGALGLEALSRGAAQAVFLDNDPAALRLARRNAANLGETAHATFLLADATRPPPGEPCTLVFLDPPYDEDLVGSTLSALLDRGWLAPGAVAVAETKRRTNPAEIRGFDVVDDRHYGKARVVFYRRPTTTRP
jgi:16S rRNA (guanine966-N2)-methyltransferase